MLVAGCWLLVAGCSDCSVSNSEEVYCLFLDCTVLYTLCNLFEHIIAFGFVEEITILAVSSDNDEISTSYLRRIYFYLCVGGAGVLSQL